MKPNRAQRAPKHGGARKPAHGGSRATCALVSALVAWLGGCATRTGWVPAIAVGGSVSRALVAQGGAPVGSAPGEREIWDLRGDVSVAWLPKPTESNVAVRRLRPRMTPSSAPCASSALCTWEREMRARASNGVAYEESAP